MKNDFLQSLRLGVKISNESGGMRNLQGQRNLQRKEMNFQTTKISRSSIFLVQLFSLVLVTATTHILCYDKSVNKSRTARKNLLVFHKSLSCIIVFTGAGNWTIVWGNLIQTTSSCPINLTYILILFPLTHLSPE